MKRDPSKKDWDTYNTCKDSDTRRKTDIRRALENLETNRLAHPRNVEMQRMSLPMQTNRPVRLNVGHIWRGGCADNMQALHLLLTRGYLQYNTFQMQVYIIVTVNTGTQIEEDQILRCYNSTVCIVQLEVKTGSCLSCHFRLGSDILPASGDY